MRYIHPTMADILGSLPPADQDELIALVAAAGAAGTIGWLAVPDTIWTALTDQGGTP